MVRSIAAVIVGYIVLTILVMAGLGLTWMVMGPEGVYRPGEWNVTPVFAAIVLAAGFVAAIVGGMVCRLIGARQGTVFALAGALLVLGIIQAAAVGGQQRELPEARPEGPVDMAVAMNTSRQPAWSLWGTPVAGVAGVLLGGMVLGRGSRESG